MQLPDKSGISCDLCGIRYQFDFMYYSFDFKNVIVTANRKPALTSIVNYKTVFSIDVCTECFDPIKKAIIQNNVKSSRSVTCEISGTKLTGTFDYYYCMVSEATVKMSGQLSICAKCKTQTSQSSKPCVTCQGTEFFKPASIRVDDRFLEFSLCESVYKDYTQRVNKTRQTLGQWTTKIG